MRGVIVSIILFVALTILIVFNTIFVTNEINFMKNHLNSLQDIPCEENTITINDFESHWKKINVYFSLSVSSDDIEEVTDTLDSLKVANETRNLNQFLMCHKQLLNAIEDIGRLEKFSIKNIL